MKRISYFLLILSVIIYADKFTYNNFLNSGAGVRPDGLGNTFAAIANDLNAIYYNPAGLNQIKHKEIIGMYSRRFGGVDDIYFASEMPLSTYDNIGFAFIGQMVGNIPFEPGWTPDGTPLKSNSFFSEKEMQVIVSYSRKFLPRFYVGGNVKFGYQHIGSNLTYQNYNLTGEYGYNVSSDLGILFKAHKYFNAGINVQNILSSDFIWSTNSYIEVPLNVKLGLSGFFFDHKLIIGADYDYNGSNDYLDNMHIGVEYSPFDFLQFRAGYGFRKAVAGIGYQLLPFQFDYAISYHELGLSHRISMTYKFGKVINHLINGKKYFGQNEYYHAINEFEEVLRVNPDNIVAKIYLEDSEKRILITKHYKKGIQYFNQGLYKEAYKQWIRALKLDPDNIEIKALLKSLD